MIEGCKVFIGLIFRRQNLLSGTTKKIMEFVMITSDNLVRAN